VFFVDATPVTWLQKNLYPQIPRITQISFGAKRRAVETDWRFAMKVIGEL
jgi:hypothetical protein